VYVKLVGQQADWRNRAQFIAIAAEQMNRILRDHARKRNAVKRGRDFVKSPMDVPGKEYELIDVRSPTAVGLPVREALDRLAKKHWRRSLVAELHVTWGFTEAQIAECLDLSIEQIRRDWHFARSWLKAELG
jgi:RNA polymerase sigma factor (TIGR02999 family)